MRSGFHYTLYVMQETISYYNANGSNVYALMLDASKAFDRVKFSKLFRILLNRQMSPLVLRLLFYMYTNQKLQVRWGGTVSTKFTASNGVKQGAILSPILFSVYMDELFERLEKKWRRLSYGESLYWQFRLRG